MDKEKKLELQKPIKICKILSIEKHPNADRLLILQVDLGDSKRQVVTGAPNLNVGDIVPFLDSGNVIPGFLILKGENVILTPRPLRGIVSDCMVLSEDEIGISDDHTGVLVLNTLPQDTLLVSSLEEHLGKSLVDVMKLD